MRTPLPELNRIRNEGYEAGLSARPAPCPWQDAQRSLSWQQGYQNGLRIRDALMRGLGRQATEIDNDPRPRRR